MFSSWVAGCRHFFHLVNRVSQARTCALAGDKETLNFAKVGLVPRRSHTSTGLFGHCALSSHAVIGVLVDAK